MNTVLSFTKRHSFVVFAILAYLLSWWSAPFTNGQIIPYGPAVAALIVIAITSGKSGLSLWWRRLTKWRVAWYWYLIAPGIVAAYSTGAYLLNLHLGANAAGSPHLPTLATMLELLLLGGMWEEPGWSGYALPTLQERYAGRPNAAVKATLVTGTARAIWHLPLVIYGHISWFDMLIYSFAFQIMIAWLFNRSGGSVLIVMLFHLTSNISAAIMFPAFTGAARMSYYVLLVAMGCVTALVILWKSNLKMGLEATQKTQAVVGHQAA